MDYIIVRTAPNELKHFGIKGQKWGVRRFENEDGTLTAAGKKRYNENYSTQQRLRDRAVYGKGGERRINKHMNEGYGVQGARSLEAARINNARNRAAMAGTVGAVAGVGIGLFAPEIIKAGATALKRSGKLGSLPDTLISAMSNQSNRTLTRIGAQFVTPKLSSAIARRATMRVHGYSPSKYSGATGAEAASVASNLAGIAGLGGY